MIAFLLPGQAWRRPWLPARVGIAILIAESVSGLLKQEFGRARPPIADPEPSTLVALPHTSSFPSGHASVSFACATILALAVPRWSAWFFGLAALIGFSRVYVGVHFPSDVLAGALLGVVIALAIQAAARFVRHFARTRVSPNEL